MYKVKRFSRSAGAVTGGAAGLLGGLTLAGKFKAGPKATRALVLGGTALGAGTGYLLGGKSKLKKKAIDTTNTRKIMKEMEVETQKILNEIVLPNLPKEYDKLRKYAEGAIRLEDKYYKPQDDWELYTLFREPEEIAEQFQLKVNIGDNLPILEFGCQDRLSFHYNIKDKNWYYLDRNVRGLTKVMSFKKLILDLYEEDLEDFKNEGDEFADYIEYLKQMIKYTKGSSYIR